MYFHTMARKEVGWRIQRQREIRGKGKLKSDKIKTGYKRLLKKKEGEKSFLFFSSAFLALYSFVALLFSRLFLPLRGKGAFTSEKVAYRFIFIVSMNVYHGRTLKLSERSPDCCGSVARVLLARVVRGIGHALVIANFHPLETDVNCRCVVARE